MIFNHLIVFINYLILFKHLIVSQFNLKDLRIIKLKITQIFSKSHNKMTNI